MGSDPAIRSVMLGRKIGFGAQENISEMTVRRTSELAALILRHQRHRFTQCGKVLPCSLRLLGAGGPEDGAPTGIKHVSVIWMTDHFRPLPQRREAAMSLITADLHANVTL